MKAKITILLALSALVILTLTGCPKRHSSAAALAKTQAAKNLEGGPDTSGPVKVNYVAETRTFTYTHSSPLTMPDGQVIKAGDLKPFWQWVEKQLGITFQDVTTQSKSQEIIQTQSATGFKDANIYGGNSVTADLMNYGAQGYFIDLNDYLTDEYMPNFKAYLERNGTIRKSITAYDGGVYFIPYIAEIGNYARAFMARQSWVRVLLDGGPVEEESGELSVFYQPYWTGKDARHGENIIALQNAAAQNGVIGFKAARDALLKYIKTNYPSLEKPSELYLGVKAQYDMDELVALWRVVRLAPNTLSKQVTGSPVPGAQIIPFFFRQTAYREDLLRLANYFNGQRVYGSDSYDARFYLDKDGVLQYSYSQDNFLDNILPILKTLYKEGIVAPDFATVSLKDNFRSIYFGGDLKAGNTKFGFMTYDFISSSASVSLGGGRVQTDVTGCLPPLTKIPGVSDKFVYWVENTRVIKNDGWAISSVTGGKKLRDVLRLFDYMFSEEGNTAQNFGMPYMIDPVKYVNAQGVEYPRMNKWFNDSFAAYSNGDGALFARNFVGFNFPIGYEKSIGFEQQFTTKEGTDTGKLYDDAGVRSLSYQETENPFWSLVPPVFSLNDQLQRQLLDTNIGNSQAELIFSYITTDTTSIAQIKEAYANGKIDAYIQVYRDAYDEVYKN